MAMKSITIKLNNIEDIAFFVNKAREVDGDVYCMRGRYCIDAKSVLGMLSIDCSAGVRVDYPEDAKNFENYLNTLV